MKKRDNDKQDDVELTIAHLTQHIEALRDAVPVNYELKARLKKRLLEQLKQKQDEQQHKPKQQVNKRKLFALFGLLGLFLVLSSYLMWPQDSLKISSMEELGTFSVEGFTSEHPITVSADGQYVVLEQDGSLVLITRKGERRTLLKPATGIFHSPVWSHQGDLLAVIYETEKESQIWVLQASLRFASRPIYSGVGTAFSSLVWSEDDQWLLVEASHSEKEVIQVRHDGSQVLKGALERATEQEIGPSLDRIKWPKNWREKLFSASRLWVAWNGDKTALVVAFQPREGEEGEMVLIQLKQEIRGEKTSEHHP